MDASGRNVLGLISEMNVRFVVPVYQRPYSWEQAQCAQLLDDTVTCGLKQEGSHFTGSIVTIQDGAVSEAGVAPLLLIDGQQRVTTVTLLLVALARYAQTHPGERLSFSRDEIVLSGYLTNHFRQGADHYKLTLSKQDGPIYQALIDNLEDPSKPFPEARDSRVLENLAFFEQRLERLRDVDALWRGLQRLEVVSVALTQGRDDPQAIFESMNSTGKGLSTADLARNFILMSYPMDQQERVFRTYWKPLEDSLAELGPKGYDGYFEEFLRAYLAATNAPHDFSDADCYQAFKRYVRERGYDSEARTRSLILKLRSFCVSYVGICGGPYPDAEVARALGRLQKLDAPETRPLLMVALDAWERHALSKEALLRALAALESYLVRRSAAGLPADGLAAFFSSMIERLDVAFEWGLPYEKAFCRMLREAPDAARMPDDAEFRRALASRAGIAWKDAGFVARSLKDAGAAWPPESEGAEGGTGSIAPETLDAALALWPLPRA